MSRSLNYQVIYTNGKRRTIAGLFNGHGANYSTSHFNGPEKDRFIRDICAFEDTNKKQIKRRELWFNVSTTRSADKWLGGLEPIEYAFPAFRETLDRVFEMVNTYTGQTFTPPPGFFAEHGPHFLNVGCDFIAADGKRITSLQLCRKADNRAEIDAEYIDGSCDRLTASAAGNLLRPEPWTALATRYFSERNRESAFDASKEARQ